MLPVDDLRLYLPKYLSPTSEEALFKSLEQFEDTHGNKNYFTDHRHPKLDIICQADGIQDLLIVNLPDTTTKPGPAMVISNSCDIDPANAKFFNPSICYCPILNLQKYEKVLLEEGKNQAQIDGHFSSIRNQRISNIFYLPTGGKLPGESFVFLDQICSCANDYISRADIENRRIFTLSNFGFYIFLTKLAIHFTRIREGIDRDILNFGISSN